MGELIRDKCQVKLKENQDEGSITEVSVLKENEANETMDLYRAACGIPENRMGLGLQEARSWK